MHSTNPRRKGRIVPFVVCFAEPRTEFLAPRHPYSEEDQLGIWDPMTVTNPMYMSPTSIETPQGDKTGDEAY